MFGWLLDGQYPDTIREKKKQCFLGGPNDSDTPNTPVRPTRPKWTHGPAEDAAGDRPTGPAQVLTRLGELARPISSGSVGGLTPWQPPTHPGPRVRDENGAQTGYKRPPILGI